MIETMNSLVVMGVAGCGKATQPHTALRDAVLRCLAGPRSELKNNT